MSFAYTPENEAKFEKIAARYPKKVAATLWALWIAQWQEGYLPMECFPYLAKKLECSPMEVYACATFYTMFHIGKPKGKYHIQVCKTLSCMLMGRDGLLEVIKEELGIIPGETSADGKFSVECVECLGACGGAPMICLNEDYHEYLTPHSLRNLIKELQ